MTSRTVLVDERPVHITGSGGRAIVMLHGWPDTAELWQPQVEHFSPDYTCVTFTLPGFARGDRRDYSVADVVARIGAVVDAVSPDDKVILLVHDWGCIFGYEYAMQNPDRVDKMIALDVGDIDAPELRDALSVAQKLMVFTYQIILAISFVSPRPVGDAIARFMARALRAASNIDNVHAGMSMPYAMRWFGMNGGLTNLTPVALPFPFYYGYAARKPMMFHSPQWLALLRSDPRNHVQAYDCGHWINVEKAAELNGSVARWLAG